MENFVATAITACGFVTLERFGVGNVIISCNSDYRLRFCNSLIALARCMATISLVATAITACGFVTVYTGIE